MSELLDAAKEKIARATDLPRTASEQDRWLERGSRLALVALADAVEQLVETIKTQAPVSVTLDSTQPVGYISDSTYPGGPTYRVADHA